MTRAIDDFKGKALITYFNVTLFVTNQTKYLCTVIKSAFFIG